MLLRLATVEVQLCAHFLDRVSLLLLGRCCRRLHTDLAEPFAWRHACIPLTRAHHDRSRSRRSTASGSDDAGAGGSGSRQAAGLALAWSSSIPELGARLSASRLLRRLPVHLDWATPLQLVDLTSIAHLRSLRLDSDVHSNNNANANNNANEYMQLSSMDFATLFAHPALRELEVLRLRDTTLVSVPACLVSLPSLHTLEIRHLNGSIDESDDKVLLHTAPNLTDLALNLFFWPCRDLLASVAQCTQLRRLQLHQVLLEAHGQFGALFSSDAPLTSTLECLELGRFFAGADRPSISSLAPLASEYASAMKALRLMHTLTLCFVHGTDAILRHAALAPQLSSVVVAVQPMMPRQRAGGGGGSSSESDAMLPSLAAVATLLDARPQLHVRIEAATSLEQWLHYYSDDTFMAKPDQEEQMEYTQQWAQLQALAELQRVTLVSMHVE
jgi:hypothetical protein